MGKWESYTMRMTVVGPRWRDRIRMAWLILRGHTRMEYSIDFQLMTAPDEPAIFIDSPEARLIRDTDE